jgi:N-acyl-D-amino-acid deacylase
LRLVIAVLLLLLIALPARADAYDDAMSALMERWQIPGGALAVAKDGKIVKAQGYGVADRRRNAPVTETSLFRLASLNKPITAVAILILAEDGKLRLDDKVLPILGDAEPRPDRIADNRVAAITVRHLLQHRGGFDRRAAGDPMFGRRAVAAAERQGAPMPPSCDAILRDALEHKLDFAPGARAVYSNVGYCILTRVVEIVSGRSYEDFVRTRVLAPAGADAMRRGRTLTAAPGEVTYYDAPDAKRVTPMPGHGLSRDVAAPYGGFSMESLDGVGGWIGAPADYLRFLLAVERGLIAPESLKVIAPGPSWSHGGSLPGTEASFRSDGGIAWVVAFNSRPAGRHDFRAELRAALGRIAAGDEDQ